MKREHFRANEIATDNWIVSDSIKWQGDSLMLYNHDESYWVGCEPSTRSVSYPNMLDKNNKPIFASLSEDGRGGDEFQILRCRFFAYMRNGCVCMYDITNNEHDSELTKFSKGTLEAIGIHK